MISYYSNKPPQNLFLRRFIAVVADHAKIKSLALKTEQRKVDRTEVKFDSERLNKIIGTELTEKEQKKYLNSLSTSRQMIRLRFHHIDQM